MGLLDLFKPKNDSGDNGQWGDVPLGFRLGLLGQIIASAGSGQAAPMGGFAAMQAMTQNKINDRKAAKQMELASKYLEKRPDLKPLVESGAIDIADIIKMDREDQVYNRQLKDSKDNWLFQQDYLDKKGDEDRAETARIAAEAEKAKRQLEWEDWFKKRGIEAEDAKKLAAEKAAQEEIALKNRLKLEQENKIAFEKWKTENDPNSNWWQQFSGQGAPSAPQNAPIPTSPGVPTTPAPAPPGPTPGVPGATNTSVTQRMREATQDPKLTDQEANYLFQTVRNPDDLRVAYDNILKNRIEADKANTAKLDLAAKKQEADKKEADAKASADNSRMTAITAIDKTLQSMDDAILPTAGFGGQMLSNFGGTGAFATAVNLDTLKSFISLDKLTQMRTNSATGASGLGQVTNYEQKMLATAEGSINQGLDEDTLKNNLKEIRARIIAFNTPSKEDPTKSQLTVDSERLASNPTPEVIAEFEQKYGIGSSSVITGDTTPASDRAGAPPAAVVNDEEIDGILKLYPEAK